MRIEPRQELLAVWRAMAAASLADDRTWKWGGRAERNSISDAEQLLCIMYPAYELPAFRLHAPDETERDVLAALNRGGDSVELPRTLVRAIGEYLETYRADGRPAFAGGSYFRPSVNMPEGAELTSEQRGLEVVDAYSMSITLTLNILGFLSGLLPSVVRASMRNDILGYQELAKERLTAAMVGLMRSFTVNPFEPASLQGKLLVANIRQSGTTERKAVEDFHVRLASIRSSLNTQVLAGSGSEESLDNPNLLFECGWTWGVAEEAPSEVFEEKGTQLVGVAPRRPFLYFTGIALDGIEDVFSERTRILGLLDEKHQRLASALNLRFDLTRQYWATMAMFGIGRWPVEDIPWTTSDGQASDYYSLLVASTAVQDLETRGAVSDTELRRIYQILSDLASRGRITRRATPEDDGSVRLHAPGVPLTLVGGDKVGGPELGWDASNFGALLLKRTIRVAGLAQSTELRNQVLDLVGQLWEHVSQRRLRTGAGTGLWDQTADVFPGMSPPAPDQPSWYFTERIVECLVAAGNLIYRDPARSGLLANHVADLLSEAEHLLDRELLAGSAEAGGNLGERLRQVRMGLERAKSIATTRPGSAVALAQKILADLDELDAARASSAGQ
jgi:hypothetical protein